jgi:hypothetical protein
MENLGDETLLWLANQSAPFKTVKSMVSDIPYVLLELSNGVGTAEDYKIYYLCRWKLEARRAEEN